MKEIKNDFIKKFSLGDYVIYIKETNGCYESYIQNEKYGVIDLMFGVMKEDYSLKEIEDLIELNIKEYIEIYKQDYED